MALAVAYALFRNVNYKLIDAATATGVAKSQLFVTPPVSDAVLTLVAKKTGVFTALTIDLEVSPDEGTTWEKHTTGITLFGGTARLAIGPNLYCRSNIVTFTGGTSVDVWGTIGGT